MLSILFIRQYNPFFENGASANRFAGLIKGLTEHGVDVSMIITKGYWSLHEFKRHGIPEGLNHLNVRYTVPVFNNSIWFRRFNSIVLGKLIYQFNSRIIRKAFSEKYDYIWLTKDTFILEEFVRNSNIIITKTLIELNEFNDIYKSSGAIGNPIQLIQAEAENRVFTEAVNKIDCFAIMTKTLMKHYSTMSQTRAKMVHIPMTTDLSRFTNIPCTTKFKKPYIAFTGTFNNAKDGVDVSIKAFAKIASKYPDLHLYLAGFWHYDVPGQKQIIADNNLENRISYIGTLNSMEIPEFVCNANLLVLSRPDSHQARGGFPTKLGEYLATGNPVCVTKVGEIPDYLEDNVSAFIAEPGDVDSFVNAMDRALTNNLRAKKVGLNGRKVAEKEFNSEIQATKLYNFLKENL